MDILTFFDKHADSLFPILGTLAGVAITLFFTWLMKKREFINQLIMKRIDFEIEFEKENLIKPVLLFLESDLKLMAAIYQKGLEPKAVEIDKSLGTHILDMSMASARIGVYGNEALNKKFDEFTRKRIQVGFDALNEQDKKVNDAFNKMKEAESLASEIIVLLKGKMKNLKT